MPLSFKRNFAALAMVLLAALSSYSAGSALDPAAGEPESKPIIKGQTSWSDWQSKAG